MKLQMLTFLSLVAVITVKAYEKYAVQPGEAYESADPKQKKQPTYYTDDGKNAVFLTLKERRIIERILKPHIWSDQDYDQKIDDKFIKRYTGGCEDCSDDALLFKKVMNDFKGKIVRTMFDKLNLRNDL